MPESMPIMLHQAADTSPVAIVSISSVCCMESISGPPHALGMAARKTPEFLSRFTTATGSCRFCSISSEFSRSSGTIARTWTKISCAGAGTSVPGESFMASFDMGRLSNRLKESRSYVAPWGQDRFRVQSLPNSPREFQCARIGHQPLAPVAMVNIHTVGIKANCSEKLVDPVQCTMGDRCCFGCWGELDGDDQIDDIRRQGIDRCPCLDSEFSVHALDEGQCAIDRRTVEGNEGQKEDPTAACRVHRIEVGPGRRPEHVFVLRGRSCVCVFHDLQNEIVRRRWRSVGQGHFAKESTLHDFCTNYFRHGFHAPWRARHTHQGQVLIWCSTIRRCRGAVVDLKHARYEVLRHTAAQGVHRVRQVGARKLQSQNSLRLGARKKRDDSGSHYPQIGLGKEMEQ